MRVTRVVALLLALPAGLRAQDAPAGAVILQLPTSPRAAGFGEAFLAGDGPDVAWLNPAQLSQGRGAMGVLMRLGSGATAGSFVSVGRLGFLSLAAGAQYLDYGLGPGGYPPALGDLPHRGPADASSIATLLGAAATWRGVRWGAAMHYLADQQPAGRTDGVGFDLGAAREVAGITVAATVRSLGADLTSPSGPVGLPTRVTVGAMLPSRRIATYFDAGVAVALSRDAAGKVIPEGGVEVTYVPVEGYRLAVRSGVRRVVEGGATPPAAIALGASFGVDRVTVDYAYQPLRGGGGTHLIGLRIE